jgi:hypothetical protein
VNILERGSESETGEAEKIFYLSLLFLKPVLPQENNTAGKRARSMS